MTSENENLSPSELKLLIALLLIPGMGPAGCLRLIRAFGSLEGIFGAGERELKAVCPDLKAPLVACILRGPDPEAVQAQLEACHRHGVRTVSYRSKEYPAPLLTLPCFPPVLFMKGEWLPNDEMSVSVVGTRHPTPYGVKAGRELCLGLAESGWTLVSGLARGIDTLAHESALQAGGRTVAVIGSGLDRLYPPENAALSRRIEARGCLMSEFPMGMPPHANHFPRRNRLIAALGRGIVIPEAGTDSGALITADYALQQGKDIFAMPGSVHSPASRGTHQLIQEGAHLVASHFDVLALLQGAGQAIPARRLPRKKKEEASTLHAFASGPSAAKRAAVPETRPGFFQSDPEHALDENQAALLDLFEGASLSLEDLAEKAKRRPAFRGFSSHQFLPGLLELELKQKLKRRPGSIFEPV